MMFLNTRPQDRATSLTQALLEAGHQVESLPLLELIAEPFSETLQQLYQQLEYAQAVVVVSPTAVEIGMHYLQQAGMSLQQLQHIQWVAVGHTTAQTLARFGIDSMVPEVENSEGMLELPILKHFDLKRIAFWRGWGGRQFMMQQLQRQGVEILNFILYRRQCPQDSIVRFPQILEKLKNKSSVAVLISSEASWNHWQQLCHSYNPPSSITWFYFVLGERLTQILNNRSKEIHQTVSIIQLEHLSASEIIQHLSDGQGTL